MAVLAFLGRLLAPHALKLLTVIAAAAGVLALLLGARRAGRATAQAEGLARQLDNVEKRHAVENRLRPADAAERRRLRDKWSRD